MRIDERWARFRSCRLRRREEACDHDDHAEHHQAGDDYDHADDVDDSAEAGDHDAGDHDADDDDDAEAGDDHHNAGDHDADDDHDDAEAGDNHADAVGDAGSIARADGHPDGDADDAVHAPCGANDLPGPVVRGARTARGPQGREWAFASGAAPARRTR